MAYIILSSDVWGWTASFHWTSWLPGQWLANFGGLIPTNLTASHSGGIFRFGRMHPFLVVERVVCRKGSIAVKTHHAHHLPNPKPTLKLENRDWERHMVLQAGIHVLHGLNNGRTVVHAKEIVFFMNYFDSKVDFFFGSYCWRRHLSSFSKVQCNYSAQLRLTHALISSFGCVEWSMGYLMSPPAIGTTYRTRRSLSAAKMDFEVKQVAEPIVSFSCRWFRLLEGTSSIVYSSIYLGGTPRQLCGWSWSI